MNADDDSRVPNNGLDTQINWDRWHNLLDIQARREFTETEQREYNQYVTIVDKLDENEAAQCRPYVKALVKKHNKVISSLRQLTRAVYRAANRHL